MKHSNFPCSSTCAITAVNSRRTKRWPNFTTSWQLFLFVTLSKTRASGANFRHIRIAISNCDFLLIIITSRFTATSNIIRTFPFSMRTFFMFASFQLEQRTIRSVRTYSETAFDYYSLRDTLYISIVGNIEPSRGYRCRLAIIAN